MLSTLEKKHARLWLDITVQRLLSSQKVSSLKYSLALELIWQRIHFEINT